MAFNKNFVISLTNVEGPVGDFIVPNSSHVTVEQLQELIAGFNVGLNQSGTSTMGIQAGAVQASNTVTAATVVNGNTVTIAGQALTAAQKRATGTVTCATAIAGNTVTINGQVFTGTAGAVVLGDPTFSIDTGDTATATSLAAQVNAFLGSKVKGIVAAKSSAAVVTLYAVSEGTTGNAITLASSGSTLAVSGATLANGAAASNNTFDFAGTNTTTAASLAVAINASTTAAVQQVTATSSAAVVTITSKAQGVAGNTITLATSGATLTIGSGSTLVGGTADAVITVTR